MIHNYTAMPRARMDKLLPSLAQGYICSLQFPAWTGIFQFTAISRPALQPTQHPFSHSINTKCYNTEDKAAAECTKDISH